MNELAMKVLRTNALLKGRIPDIVGSLLEKQDPRLEEEEITGHFWIVKDNKIVDWDFKEFKELRVFHNCEEKPKYRLESIKNRRMAKKKFILEKRQHLEELREYIPSMWDEIVKDHPLPFQCSLNVCVEQLLNGGQIAYGDMGWTAKDTGEVWYEFEHSRPMCGKGDFLQIVRNIKAGRKCPKKYGFPPNIQQKILNGELEDLINHLGY